MSSGWGLTGAALVLGIMTAAVPRAESSFRANGWEGLSEGEAQAVEATADQYREFLDACRTELTTVRYVREWANGQGFREIDERFDNFRPGPGRRYLALNRDRTAALIVLGRRPLTDGVRVVASHIDAPRLELKANPLYPAGQFALFQTVYHGGIKKYQWTSRPLRLTGRVHRKDGSVVWIDEGGDGRSLVIPDLAPHVDRDFRKREQRQVIKGEELDPVAGHRPGTDQALDETVMALLAEKYEISRDDFVSAELSLVPAVAPQEVGLDGALIGGYGQDDRVCAFASVRSLMEVKVPEYTAIALLFDNEESGSNNNTGAGSSWFLDLLTVLRQLSEPDAPPALARLQARSRVVVLSADVTTGINPLFPQVQEASNASRLGYGVVIKRYGRGNDPNAEWTARVREMLDRYQIPWQTHTYKVDVGGGGTLGGFLSEDNMEVIDVGVPLLSMHSPFSLSSKVDVWNLTRFFTVFFTE